MFALFQQHTVANVDLKHYRLRCTPILSYHISRSQFKTNVRACHSNFTGYTLNDLQNVQYITYAQPRVVQPPQATPQGLRACINHLATPDRLIIGPYIP